MVGVVAAIAQTYLSFLAPPSLYMLIFGQALRKTRMGRVELTMAVLMVVAMMIIGTGFGTYARLLTLDRNIATWGVFERYR